MDSAAGIYESGFAGESNSDTIAASPTNMYVMPWTDLNPNPMYTARKPPPSPTEVVIRETCWSSRKLILLLLVLCLLALLVSIAALVMVVSFARGSTAASCLVVNNSAGAVLLTSSGSTSATGSDACNATSLRILDEVRLLRSNQSLLLRVFDELHAFRNESEVLLRDELSSATARLLIALNETAFKDASTATTTTARTTTSSSTTSTAKPTTTLTSITTQMTTKTTTTTTTAAAAATTTTTTTLNGTYHCQTEAPATCTPGYTWTEICCPRFCPSCQRFGVTCMQAANCPCTCGWCSTPPSLQACDCSPGLSSRATDCACSCQYCPSGMTSLGGAGQCFSL